MNFQQSAAYLYSLGNEVLAMKLGLENVRILLDALGNPQENYLKIQIAGTNGKGSVCAFLEAICVSAKIRIGTTTSPHLVSITERIKINGSEIKKENFARHATKVREIAEKLVERGKLENIPTYFEQVTAIALNAFAEANVELAILETGLGGRFDATTAARAEIAAITPIDFDHQDILGNSLDKIAAEKAAIIHPESKVVSSKQKPEAEKIILEQCAKFDIKPEFTDFNAEILNSDSHGKFVVNFKTKHSEYEKIKLNLAGKHQIENAKAAILLAEIVQQNYFNISTKDIVEGLQTTVHPGRLEYFAGILFDGAHNVAGAFALKNYLDEFVKQPVIMIFGAMRDKDLTEIADILFPKAAKIIFTEPENARSLEIEELRRFLPKDFDTKNVFEIKKPSEAVELARAISTERDLVCVTGSLYLAGEVRKYLLEKNENQTV